MRRPAIAACVLLLCATSPGALACGEYFGTSVLESRNQTLLTLWDASFALEARRLVQGPEGLSWSEVIDPRSGEPVEASKQVDVLGRRLHGPDWRERARAAGIEGQDKEHAPDALPTELLHYQRGADAWAGKDHAAAHPAFATAATGRATQANPWPLVAEYMHARVMLAMQRNDEAVKGFDRVVARVRSGESDPLSLGARSLSESATAHQRAGRYVEAIRLQMAQAALEVPGADVSLLWRLKAALRTDGALARLLDDPVARHAVVLFALSHFPAADAGYGWHLARVDLDWQTRDRMSEAELAALPPPVTQAEVVDAIARRLDRFGEADQAQVDRLAAMLYRQGHYEDAERLVQESQGALGAWVGAKLAVRSGNLEQAASRLRHAATVFPADELWNENPYGVAEIIERRPACRVQAEAGMLSLARGELVEGLRLFLAAGAVYWNDTAYLAERVLTIEELDQLMASFDVSTLERTPLPPRHPEVDPPVRGSGPPADLGAALRDLYARRLMRLGRHKDAIDVFADAAARDHARSYASALAAAEGSTKAERAQALYAAATIARSQGLLILAYESAPDWAALGANYDAGSLEGRLDGSTDRSEMAGAPLRLVSDIERQRVGMHRSSPEPRFSYRLRAAELADRAADHLPPDDPAFAAVLCHATRWLLNREPALARKYYRRYLQEGKPQPWHARFGKDCPDPKFPAG